MEMRVSFPGGARVDARFGQFTVQTDQPIDNGGDSSAPSPFDLFLASVATCAGIYVLGFCRQRGLPVEGINLIQRVKISPKTKLAEKISLEIQLPAGFPEKYHAAVIRAAEQCKVKKHFEYPPEVEIMMSTIEETHA
jgi:ribosomal protein S12 methylthiotransferase accessory factor